MRKSEELTVITKTYDLILWSCNHTGKFPRNHRFVLGERIERNLYDLLEILIRAKYTKRRQELLEQANLVLEILVEALEPIFEPTFVFDSYACRNGKGTHAAVKRWWEFARQFRYVLKADIQKFFPSHVLEGVIHESYVLNNGSLRVVAYWTASAE